jgi:ribosomal protein S18 acetylase RimI-like enzyme
MRAGIQLRLATRRDVDDIAVMSRDLIEHGLPWRWSAERVLRSLRDRSTNVVVATGDETLLGFGIMKYCEQDAHLLLLAVSPAGRRQGIGTAILEWLEGVALTAGVKRVLLECRRGNATARNFYGTLGYHELKLVRRMYEGLEDGITLEKWLADPDPAAGRSSLPSRFAGR